MFDLIKLVVKVNYWSLFLLAFTIFVGSAYLIHYLEPTMFETPFIGFWWVMTTVTTVGFGDFVPETLAGRMVGLMLYLVGIALIGIIIGKVVEGFGLYRTLKEEGKLSFNGNDHFVVIGWSNKAKKNHPGNLSIQRRCDDCSH